MGTPRDVTWWEAPCQWDWFIPSICSAVVPADPVQPTPHASTPHAQTLTSWRALFTLRMGPSPPRSGNFSRTSDWISPEMRADDAMSDFICCQRKVSSADVLTVSYSGTNKQTLLHNPQITSRCIWPASFRGYLGYRLRDNMEWTAGIRLRSCCKNPFIAVFVV